MYQNQHNKNIHAAGVIVAEALNGGSCLVIVSTKTGALTFFNNLKLICKRIEVPIVNVTKRIKIRVAELTKSDL